MLTTKQIKHTILLAMHRVEERGEFLLADVALDFLSAKGCAWDDVVACLADLLLAGLISLAGDGEAVKLTAEGQFWAETLAIASAEIALEAI